MTEKWEYKWIGVEGDACIIHCINIWAHPWKSLKQTLEVRHPQYSHQRHSANIYEIDTEGRAIKFAAAELSANVWGIYIPE